MFNTITPIPIPQAGMILFYTTFWTVVRQNEREPEVSKRSRTVAPRNVDVRTHALCTHALCSMPLSTQHFTILNAENPSIIIFELHRVRWLAYFETLKSRSFRSGCLSPSFPMQSFMQLGIRRLWTHGDEARGKKPKEWKKYPWFRLPLLRLLLPPPGFRWLVGWFRAEHDCQIICFGNLPSGQMERERYGRCIHSVSHRLYGNYTEIYELTLEAARTYDTCIWRWTYI